MRAIALVPFVVLVACGGGADPLGTVKQAATVCAKGATVEGIDVSEWQESVDWVKVKSSGRAFGIARISYGSVHIDATFPGNWSGMKSAGLIRGAYQWFRPAQDAIAQADIVVAAVGKLGPGDLPVTVDVEEAQGLSGATITARLHTWIDRVTAGTGKMPIIYTGKYFWNDNVGSGDFAGHPLWIPQYGPTCPDLPSVWGDWRLFQYSDKGSVPGIAGGVDVNKFNGTLAELQAFANLEVNRAPRGYLDAVDCDAIRGWAQDPDKDADAIDVHLYFDSVPGDPAAIARVLRADRERTDLCSAIGSCKHAYERGMPLSVLDGKPHTIHAFAIDASGKGPNPELPGSPKTITCATPRPPAVRPVRRWIPSPEVLSAWKLDPFEDMVIYDDATLDGISVGRDVPLAPKLAASDDPALGVRLLDGTLHRHVIDPASMDAWRFDWAAIEKVADFAKYTPGVDVPARPFLAKGSGPKIYLIDEQIEPGTVVDAGPPPTTTEDASPSVDPVTPARDAPGTIEGASCAYSPRSNGSWWLMGLALLIRRRR